LRTSMWGAPVWLSGRLSPERATELALDWPLLVPTADGPAASGWRPRARTHRTPAARYGSVGRYSRLTQVLSV